MEHPSTNQELHHEIFGSILDRTEMTPFLLLPAKDYQTAFKQAAKMMGNRGFDMIGDDDLLDSEKQRALHYIECAYSYFFNWMFPFVSRQLDGLLDLNSAGADVYAQCRQSITQIISVLQDGEFHQLAHEDPRHLFLMASSAKYPTVFYGYQGKNRDIPPAWQQTACALLKMSHLIKSIEEDSQDINDYAQLGFFLASQGQNLDALYQYDWEHPIHLPESESAQLAFVKISTFFHKLKQFISFDADKNCLVFNSGDGVAVDIADIKARIKSPESMFTKLGKDIEGEAFDIRDILAITFILKEKEDTLKLIHALQKRGVILQEYTASHAITQTLFDDPESMIEPVRRLMVSLGQSSYQFETPNRSDLLANAKAFFEALSLNTARNQHSSLGHRKFQCKITFPVPIHRASDTHKTMIPGTPPYAHRNFIPKKTQQHTLVVELRISDEESWRSSEQKGESHHNAYKFRQMIAVMNRIFKPLFHLPQTSLAQLREDQTTLFS